MNITNHPRFSDESVQKATLSFHYFITYKGVSLMITKLLCSFYYTTCSQHLCSLLSPVSSIFFPVLEWSMMARATLVARQKATLCLPLWPETTGSSPGPPAVDSTSAASLGRSQCRMPGHKHCYICKFVVVAVCLTHGWFAVLTEQPRHRVWWMSLGRSVSTSIPNSFPGSCMMQTRSASGSLAPRPNCAALILSRWDITMTHL